MRNPFQSVVYLRIRRRWLGVRVLTWSGGDFHWEGAPEMFIGSDRKGKPVAIVSEAARHNPALIGHPFTAFAHPRTIVDGFEDTVLVVRQAIREAGYKSRKSNLLFLVHILDQWDGGLSDVERRALMEICRQSGAGEVRFSEEPYELTPPQVLSIARSPARVI